MADRRKPLLFFIISGMFALAGLRLGAETLKVPGDFPTIASAVSRAADGDTVLIDDGTYLEKTILLDKKIVVRSKNLFGAVIYGSARSGEAIFVVRASAKIEGCVLKGAAAGVVQRDSPDVRWEAADLAVLNCGTGFEIDDARGNIGSADIRNVIVVGDEHSVGFATNDAGQIAVSGCLIVACERAFEGYDHLSFRVKDTAMLDCVQSLTETTRHRPLPPATSRIESSGIFWVLDSASLSEPGQLGRLKSFVRAVVLPGTASPETPERGRWAVASLLDLALAGVFEKGGGREAAARCYEEAREAGEKAGSREFVWQALIGLARLEHGGKDVQHEVACYQRALDHLETWAPGIHIGLGRIGFLEDKTPAYETIIGLLVDAHERRPSMGYAAKAFAYAERSRALTGLFVSPGREGPPGEGQGSSPGKVAAAKRISEVQRRLQDPGLAAGDKEALVARLETAEEDYNGELIREERPIRPVPSPLAVREIQRRLAGRVLLSYVLGRKASYAFLVTETELECARLPPGPDIVDKVGPYLRFLELKDGRGFPGVKAGRVLFGTLLGPFAAKLPSLPRRIIVVPDGRLRYVPFETLVVDGEADIRKATERDRDPREWRFLGESVVVSYASSATRAVAEPGSAPNGKLPGRVLAVGNGDAIRCDNRAPDRKQFFQPLARVNAEIRSVARSFPQGQVRVLTGQGASERAFKAEDLETYDIIHIAAHGVVDDSDWWRSALLLGPDAGMGGEDGFLTAWEVADLTIPARLAVLSACSTGMGSLSEGAGLGGLSGAFMRAGAEAIVVSLWNVDDRATAIFMVGFYELIAGGAAPATALARAKKRMIETGYVNPFYWAPFVLIGRAD